MINVGIPEKDLADPLAREIAQTLFGKEAPALPPAVADLVREGVAVAVQRHLAKRTHLTIEELAVGMGWSVRRFRAWAREVNLPHAAGGADVFRVEDVRAALDFADGVKSESRKALEREIEDLRLQLSRLNAADRRRAKQEVPPRETSAPDRPVLAVHRSAA